MSDLSSDLAPVTATAAAVAAPLADAAAVAKFGSDVIGLFSQPLKSAQLDKPANEAQERLQIYETIIHEPEIDLDSDLGGFLLRLCVQAELPVGELSGRTRRVPVEFITSFVLGLSNLIQLREQADADAANQSVSQQVAAPVSATSAKQVSAA